ncbi:protein MOR1-like isoform X2 [Rhododendron vialii]|uniref:protein MOR1-like isoform X2 n=1 Tax=Rhododendron vialii TaxID=182163 RepID=UPI00265DD1B0|nr:protein MOR1-like isoform X2 [Rhododendron vialii]
MRIRERYAKEVCDVIAAKCLTGRPRTVEKLQMVFMLLIELESVDVVLDAMEKAVMKKVAKAVVPAIDIILLALSEFGVKIVPPKRILKLLPELFVHRDQNVRASSKGLTLELCRWIGKETVKSVLFGKMPKTMKKELEAELVSVSRIARPSRKIRSEKNKEPEEEGVGFGPSEESVTDAPQEIECVESVDPVVVLTLEKAGLGDGVKAAKWSEQKVSASKRTKLNSQLCMAPDYIAKIRQSLKKCLSDETPEVRDAAFASLEAMDKWVGAGPSEESLEKLDDVRWKNFPEMNDYSRGTVCTSSESYIYQDVSVTFQNSGGRNNNMLGLNLASIRILNELKLLRKDRLMNCSADRVSENIFHWKARIMGDPDSPYAGGEFLVDIHFPLNYPFVPPKVAFETKVFHPNIDITGDIYLGILEQWNWSPAVTMTEVLRSICTLLRNPDPAYFFVPKIAEMYNTERSKYEKTARSWTLMYAMG